MKVQFFSDQNLIYLHTSLHNSRSKTNLKHLQLSLITFVSDHDVKHMSANISKNTLSVSGTIEL